MISIYSQYLKGRRKRKSLYQPELEKKDEGIFNYHPTISQSDKEKKSNFFTFGKDFTTKQVKKQELEKKVSKENNFSVAKSINIGYYLITPLILGVFFGLLIDSLLKTKPAFTLILLSFGLIGTLYNLGKLTKEI